jgi:hypothetical protein
MFGLMLVGAFASDVQTVRVQLGLSGADLHEVEIPVDGSTTRHRFVSGVPMVARLTAIPRGDQIVMHVEVDPRSARARHLEGDEQHLVEQAVARLRSLPGQPWEFSFGPRQNGELWIGGEVPRPDSTFDIYGLTVLVQRS